MVPAELEALKRLCETAGRGARRPPDRSPPGLQAAWQAESRRGDDADSAGAAAAADGRAAGLARARRATRVRAAAPLVELLPEADAAEHQHRVARGAGRRRRRARPGQRRAPGAAARPFKTLRATPRRDAGEGCARPEAAERGLELLRDLRPAAHGRPRARGAPAGRARATAQVAGSWRAARQALQPGGRSDDAARRVAANAANRLTKRPR